MRRGAYTENKKGKRGLYKYNIHCIFLKDGESFHCGGPVQTYKKAEFLKDEITAEFKKFLATEYVGATITNLAIVNMIPAISSTKCGIVIKYPEGE